MPSKSIRGGYRLEEKNLVFTRAHNDYLEIRAEMGILGVSWFCALFGAAFLLAVWSFRKNLSAENPDEAANDILSATMGLLGYCIIQYFDFPRERIEFQVILALLFAVLVHRSVNLGFKTFRPLSPKILGIGKVLLILGLLFNLLMGWQRMRGEIHNIRLNNAQNRGDWRKLAAESTLAENTFYNYTDSATPIAWHEGVAWFQLGQFEKAATAFERAYRLNPWSFQVINNYASAMVKLNRYTEAVPLFEKALEINPRYDEGKFNLCFVYFQLADYARAETWLSRVDTIAGPSNEADRLKNRTTLKQLEEFRKVLQSKQK
jgi:tetratricopeptide (TPR) repeat protein